MKRFLQIIMILPLLWISNVMAGGGFGEPGGAQLGNSLVIAGSAKVSGEPDDFVGQCASIRLIGVCRGEDIDTTFLVADGEGSCTLPFNDALTEEDFKDITYGVDDTVIKGKCDLDLPEGTAIVGLKIKNIGKLVYDFDTNEYSAKGVVINPFIK